MNRGREQERNRREQDGGRFVVDADQVGYRDEDVRDRSQRQEAEGDDGPQQRILRLEYPLADESIDEQDRQDDDGGNEEVGSR